MIEADIESIGIVTSHMSFDGHGGANYSRHRLGQELEQRGFDVSIYTLNFSDENHVPVPHDYDLVETRIDSHTIVDGVARFFQQISQYFESNDLIHIYVPGIIPLFGLYRRVTGDDTPLVATLNGYTPFCTDTSRMGDGCWKHCSLSKKIRHGRNGPTGEFTPGNLPRTVFNQYATVPLMNEIDEYLCLSPEVRRIYRDIGVDDDRLNVVPNMIDPEFSDESAPARADGRGDDPRDDPAALANILDGLVETPERVAAMAANARLEVERFTPDDVMADVLGIYSEVSA